MFAWNTFDNSGGSAVSKAKTTTGRLLSVDIMHHDVSVFNKY